MMELAVAAPLPHPKSPRYFWTAREEKLLREHYPLGGLSACMAALPNRSSLSIYQRANALKLKSPKSSDVPRNAWEASPVIDEQIRRGYQNGIDKGAINDLAKRVGRPRWWVSQRARKLGLVSPRFKEPQWSDAEVALIEKNAHKHPETLRKILLRHGYKRTATSVVVKLKRLGAERSDPDHYTAKGLAQCFGVDPATVSSWCEHGWLCATRRGTDRTPQQGGDMWWIRHKDVRRFVIENAARVDLRKVDKFWFIDLLATPA
jgi:hypothetical protein